MKEDRKVSIILCFYNEEKYLSIAIDSVLDQTYSNFELIIVNDGSTDKSEQIVRQYKDERIKYISYTPNQHLAYARNRGLDAATGEFVGFFDADDIMRSDKIEKEICYFEQNPDTFLISGGYCLMDADGNDIKDVYPEQEQDSEIRAHMLFGNCIACAGAALFRRSVVENFHLRLDNDNHASEDYSFWIDALPYGRFANLHEIFFNYRVNYDSKASVIVKNDESAYDREIKGILSKAWKSRGFLLDEKDVGFIHYYLYKRNRISGIYAIFQGEITYRKIKKQIRELGLLEGSNILKYYRLKWKETYKLHWIIKSLIEKVRKN